MSSLHMQAQKSYLSMHMKENETKVMT